MAKVINKTCHSESDCQHTSTSPSDDSDDSNVEDAAKTPICTNQESSGEDSTMNPICAKQETLQHAAKNFLRVHFETFHESKEHSVS